MKKYIFLPFVILFITLTTNAQIDSAQIIQLATTELSQITTVLEGEVLDIEIFAGDDEGNRMPESSIVWEASGYGFYTLPNGNKAPGYTLSTVKVCQVYKGNLELKTIKILSRPTGLIVHKMPYLDRDTTWYYNTGAPDDQWPRENTIIPRSPGFKQIFFCSKWEITSVSEYYKLSIIGGVSFREDWRPNSHIEGKRTFALIGGVLQYIEPTTPVLNRQEMNDFLLSIPILDLSVTNNNSCLVANAVKPQKKM